jgi:hypothetical protein
MRVLSSGVSGSYFLSQRQVQINDVWANSGKTLVGINTNYGE